jgi:O-antigen/teichoic acid export membrane protein
MIAKLLAKLNNKHFLSLLGNVLVAGLSMLTLAILFRTLTKVDIGYWFFYQTIFVLLDTFRTGFLQIALITFYTGTDEARSKVVLGSVWYWAILITIILAVINLLLFPIISFLENTGFIITLQWFGITFIATLPASIASWILQADQRFDKLLLLRAMNYVTFILGVLCLIFLNKTNLENLLIINCIINALVSFVVLLLGWSRLTTVVNRTKECIKEIYHYGKFSVGTTISANLLRSSDTFIITFLLGPATLAIYNIPIRLMEIIEIPLRSTIATGMSSLAKAYNRKNLQEVGYILQKYAGTLSIAFIPVAIVAFLLADIGVGLLGGGKYIDTEAANVYRIMMTFAIFYPIDRFIAVSLDIIHKPHINFIKVIFMLIANVIGDFVGIKVFGNIYGVAIGTFLPLCIGIFFGYHHLRKQVEFDLKGIFTFGYLQLRNIIKDNIKLIKS